MAREGRQGKLTRKGDQRIIDSALLAVDKGTGKGNWGSGKGPKLEHKEVRMWQKWQGCESWRKEVLAEKQTQERRQRDR